MKCRNCNETGHAVAECTQQRKPPSCHMCGTSGHREPRCPNKHCLGVSRGVTELREWPDTAEPRQLEPFLVSNFLPFPSAATRKPPSAEMFTSQILLSNGPLSFEFSFIPAFMYVRPHVERTRIMSNLAPDDVRDKLFNALVIVRKHNRFRVRWIRCTKVNLTNS